MSNLLMSQREALKWTETLSSEAWNQQVWESLALSSLYGISWLFSLLLLVVCLVPPMRRKVHCWTNIYLPWNACVGLFIIQGFVGIFGHPALFSSGVLAYWVNQLIPASVLEPTAEFTNYFTVIGWLTWS